MNRAVFLDTSAWVAAADGGQTHHEKAKAAYTAAVRGRRRILTTPLVLAETQVLLIRLQGRDRALQGIESALLDPSHDVVACDAAVVQSAIDRWIRPFRDQKFSLCDAVSFEIMRQERITNALSLDAHFVTAGFEIIR